MSAETVLVVQSDDFGMCHAVNEGIVQAFTEGILTQSTSMVPCPWFDEAVELAQQHTIPVGMHSTLTAEWDRLRWRPLTGGRGLRGEDGTFHRTIKDAREQASVSECTAELEAQAERFLGAGLDPIHFDCHMGVVHTAAYEHICRRHERRFLYPVGEAGMQWDTLEFLSGHPRDKKLDRLCRHLEGLGPGRHLIITHCAVESAELEAMTSPDNDNYMWAQDYRVTDLEVLTHPRPHEIVERRGIRLTSVEDLG